MDLPALARHPRARRIAIGLVLGAIAVAAWWELRELTRDYVPYVDYDTQIYREIAERPFGLGLQVYNKPLFVPLLYRLVHGDLAAMVGLQTELAFAAWAILTASLVLALRRRWTRVLAVGLGAAFLFAPSRVGFTASLMSESIGDSLAALVLAGLIGVVRLRGRARLGVAIATGVVVVAWVLTRDTNAFVAVTAAGGAMIVWRGWRHRAAWIVSALVVVLAAVVMWSTAQPHDKLPYQQGWYARITPRGMYPMVDNIMMRAYPDLRDEVPAGLRPFAEPRERVWELVLDQPELRPLQDWLVDRGAATYARWLVRHPVDRVAELASARWTMLAASLNAYMPKGWSPGGSALRKLTTRHGLLVVLLLACPLLLLRPRGDPLCSLVLCMVGSGVVGAVASYYGDGAEVARHCYGAGQQVVLGVFLAVVVWLDRVGWPRTRAQVA